MLEKSYCEVRVGLGYCSFYARESTLSCEEEALGLIYELALSNSFTDRDLG